MKLSQTVEIVTFLIEVLSAFSVFLCLLNFALLYLNYIRAKQSIPLTDSLWLIFTINCIRSPLSKRTWSFTHRVSLWELVVQYIAVPWGNAIIRITIGTQPGWLSSDTNGGLLSTIGTVPLWLRMRNFGWRCWAWDFGKVQLGQCLWVKPSWGAQTCYQSIPESILFVSSLEWRLRVVSGCFSWLHNEGNNEWNK